MGFRPNLQHFKLEIWDKPASPCLSSRVPYGQFITASKMKQIESAESYIESLGFKIVRVRHLNDIASIEVNKDDIKRLISLKTQLDHDFKEFGFSGIEIDLEGYKSGKLNRSLHE